MPVSPQDFALWSRMTGNPYPQSPAERMALAPEVYSYTRNIGRQGGPTMNPIRRAVDVAGKVALGAGLLAGAGYLAAKGYEKLELDNEPDIGSTVTEAMPNVNSQVAQNSGDVTGSKTSDNYNQLNIFNSTKEAQLLRGTNPQKPTAGPIEQKTATQSEVIGNQQHFAPGTEEQQLASSAQPDLSVRDRAQQLIDSVSGATRFEREEERGMSRIESLARQERLNAKLQTRQQYGQETMEPSPASWGVESADPSTLRELMSQKSVIAPPQTTTVVPGPVRMTPQTRVAVVKEESPIAEMATVATPVTVTSPAPQRQTAESMADEHLARTALNHLPREQALGLLAAARAQKGSKTVGDPTETLNPIVTTRQPQPVRVASEVSAPEARISPNEFLSSMSQQVGPVATYAIPAERSKAVSGLAFYPGGEIGVQMGKRRGGPTEYAYATADPYRLALSDYAEEGFPEGMGNIGGIVADKALAHQMGLQSSVDRGGTIRQQRQPIYTGLMSDADIMSAGIGKSGSSRNRAMEQAERHFETRNIMQDLEERAARRRQGLV